MKHSSTSAVDRFRFHGARNLLKYILDKTRLVSSSVNNPANHRQYGDQAPLPPFLHGVHISSLGTGCTQISDAVEATPLAICGVTSDVHSPCGPALPLYLIVHYSPQTRGMLFLDVGTRDNAAPLLPPGDPAPPDQWNTEAGVLPALAGLDISILWGYTVV